jgi:hypothetical protein
MIHASPAAAPDIAIVRNTPLTEPGQNRTASNVGEPSVAVNGDVVFYTGNWYAALSVDGGRKFKFIDPNNLAQPSDPADVTFCCDQVVNYMPSIDTFVWLLQYGPSTGDNIQRLAFAKTADVALGRWRTFDITTEALGVPKFFLDFPDVAVGAGCLYVTTNCFGPDGSTVGSAVARLTLDSIGQNQPKADKFVSMELFSFRVAQNCRDTAYFAAHMDTSTLAVFSWPETQALPTRQDVPVARWLGTNGYFSRTPDGRRWLDRADPRLTGATLAGDELWFAWSVDTNSNHRSKPFVQIARLNRPDLSLIENVNIFDPDSATCYAGLATNSRNEIGISYMIGGNVFPSHVVGILGTERQSLVTSAGGRGPLPDADGHFEWGDFLTTRPVFPAGPLFAATGYTLEGTQDGQNVDATPRLVIFGRAADSVSTGGGVDNGTPTGPTDVGGTGTTISTGGPITDVNLLQTVSPTVAVKIKTACGIHSGIQAIGPATPLLLPELVTKPGIERWPVKTGQDADRNLVGKNIIAGTGLGAGIVPVTVEELISMPRPLGLENINADPAGFRSKRSTPAETIIWRIEVMIIVLKLEADGDYHLVLQGASGNTMVGEVPMPTVTFIGDSPWLKNIKDARQAVDDRLVHPLSPQDFVLPPGGTKLVPRTALSGDYAVPPMAAFKMPDSFETRASDDGLPMPAFQTAIKSTPARITGVGFFDRMHGQTGVAPNVIELHPILKIEWM